MLENTLKRGKSVFLFGARQTGKTTLINRFTPALSLNLIRPDVRQRYEKAPALLTGEIEACAASSGKTPPLVIVDEAQKVPQLMDVVQDLIDRKVAQFILTGSSARKLRRHASANTLPGRVSILYLDPLSTAEYTPGDVAELMMYGSLPGIVTVKDPEDRERDLADYVTTYLEEEIRAEAATRNLGAFARFLEFAAAESGAIVNLRKAASDVGVAHTTIAGYYQILEDCLIAARIEPLCVSATRHKLTKSDRFLFFDLGVRRVAAHEGRTLDRVRLGTLFKQFVGLELLRALHARKIKGRLKFWRDPDGPEVDWLIDHEGDYAPIEVKWTDAPTLSDVRHLQTFLAEYPTARHAYLVCRTPRKIALSRSITALPWHSFIAELSD